MNKLALLPLAVGLVSCGPLHHVTYKLDAAQLEKMNSGDTVQVSHKHNVEGKRFRLADRSYEEIAVRDNSNVISYLFFYPSGQLKAYTWAIHGFYFGKSPLYNEKGYLVKITNNDAPFKYSINRLSAKFAFGYGLDIFKEGTNVVKSTDDNNNPVYRLTFPINSPDGNKARRFIIDGSNGKLLSNTVVSLPQQEKEALPLH